MGRNIGWHDPMPNDNRYWQHYYKPLDISGLLMSLCGNHYLDEGTKLKYNMHKKLCKKCQNARAVNAPKKRDSDRRFTTGRTKKKSMFKFAVPEAVVHEPKPEIIVGLEQ